jgi:outer membrane protein OmpA-like peptidoglycan-associated protein
MEMHARLASGFLLALGFADLAALNLLLAPRLEQHAAMAATAAPPTAAPPPTPAPAPRSAPACPPPPPSAAPAPAPTTARPTGEPATPDVLFELGETHVPGARGEDIRRVAALLRDRAARRILVRGHSDRLGPSDKNLKISWERAESVRRLLVAFGAPPERLVVEAVGDAEPVSPEDTPRGWARNRRVQILWR